MDTAAIGVIGGTGVGQTMAEMMQHPTRHHVQTPFGSPSGPILVGRLGHYQVAFLNRHGPGHGLNPSCIPYTANIFALKQLGVRAILATGAVGSLRARIRPGDLVVVDQFIDKTYRRLGSFFDAYGAVHCELADPVCLRLANMAIQAARKANIKTHPRGTYMCMEGPQFSTRAESLMHRAWGGDLIGMTGMPEARLAREAQVCYCLLGLITDYDCWQVRPGKDGQDRLLEYIMANIKTASDRGLRLIRELLDMPGLLDDGCACRHSLDLAIWTDRDYIPAAKVRAYRILFK